MGLEETNNPILGWRTVASAESWDEQVVDLQQLGDTSVVCGSKHPPPDSKIFSRAGNRRGASLMLVLSPDDVLCSRA